MEAARSNPYAALQASMNTNPFSALPEVIHFKIIHLLNPKDTDALETTCKYNQRISKEYEACMNCVRSGIKSDDIVNAYDSEGKSWQRAWARLTDTGIKRMSPIPCQSKAGIFIPEKFTSKPQLRNVLLTKHVFSKTTGFDLLPSEKTEFAIPPRPAFSISSAFSGFSFPRFSSHSNSTIEENESSDDGEDTTSPFDSDEEDLYSLCEKGELASSEDYLGSGNIYLRDLDSIPEEED